MQITAQSVQVTSEDNDEDPIISSDVSFIMSFLTWLSSNTIITVIIIIIIFCCWMSPDHWLVPAGTSSTSLVWILDLVFLCGLAG